MYKLFGKLRQKKTYFLYLLIECQNINILGYIFWILLFGDKFICYNCLKK